MEGVKESQSVLFDNNPDAILLDGFDDCYLGIAEGIGCALVAVYDAEKVVDKLAADMGQTEATEYFYLNMNVYGANQPIYLWRCNQ